MDQFVFTMHEVVKKVQMEWETVKTLIGLLLLEQSDLGLHCLPRPMYPNISIFLVDSF